MGMIINGIVSLIITALVITLASQVISTEKTKEATKNLAEIEDNLKIQIESLKQTSNTLVAVEKNIQARIEKEKNAAERLDIINPQSFEDYCNKNKTSPEEFIVQEVGGQVTIKFNDLSSKDRLVGIIQTKAKIDLLVNTPLEAIQIVDFKERVTIINPDERFAGYIQVENTGFSLVPLIVKK